MAPGRLCNRDGWILTTMVLTEIINVGVNTLIKSVTSKGLSPFVVLVYSYTIGSLLPVPLIYFSFRSRSLPPLNFSVLCNMGLLGLIAFSLDLRRRGEPKNYPQIAGYNGIKYSSPTFSSAMSNVTPAFTFILAVIFRLIGGILISIGFYMVLWGKAKETIVDTLSIESSPSQKSPLLGN